MMCRIVALAAAIAAVPLPAFAQPPAASRVLSAVAARRAPVIDGLLDDPVWQKARFASDFHQQQPVEGGPPTVPTEIAFAYDGEALYVAARMFVARPGDVSAVMTRRDDTGAAERIIISLDTFNDRRTAYSFAVTAAGVRADWLHPDDATFPRDSSYNPVWEAEVHHEPDRWTAEMKIPFSQLRFRAAEDEYRWGININRFIAHRNEDIFWIVVPKGENGWSSYFGELRGIRGIRPTRRIELLPYVAADLKLTSPSLVDPDDPFADEIGAGGRAGLDAKMGLGPNLTLDATINPDFGQVEADPAVVNLTAFETQFAERRPFFIEGSQLLTGSGPTYYYSRRIGAAPRGEVDADFADVPSSTRILGAAKLTGRLPSRLSVGALTALTQRITADSLDLATGDRTRVPVEPLASYNLVRLEQELGENSSRIGATLSGVYRSFDATSPLADQFNRWATTGGADWNLRWDGARYELAGAAGFSAVGGEAAAIAALQQNSTHYFQRPDQDHVTLDPTRTSMLGWTASLSGGKRSGHWRWNLASYAESPGFELNDLGLFFAGDDIGTSGQVTFNETDIGDYLHAWDLGATAYQEWNFGGARAPAGAELFGSMTLRNFWRINARSRLGFPGLDDSLTRGGPLAGVGWSYSGGVGVNNSYASRTGWSAAFDWDVHQTGPTGVSASTTLTLRPIDRLELSLSPRYLHRTSNRLYVDTIDGAGGATFGSRYLFADVRRRELSLTTRLQVVFSPDLAVELFAQPFTSSGAFTSFGELPAANSRGVRDYGTDGTTIDEAGGVYTVTDGTDSFTFDDPDFTVLSLRSTLVLRWEFLPGSTLFFVWQQNRGDQLAAADALGNAGDAFTSPGRNVFALKIAYWWPAL
jgi:hypothetical protein